jgi:hypothetical protein
MENTDDKANSRCLLPRMQGYHRTNLKMTTMGLAPEPSASLALELFFGESFTAGGFAYSRCMTSSITAFPFLSTEMTLWMGA